MMKDAAIALATRVGLGCALLIGLPFHASAHAPSCVANSLEVADRVDGDLAVEKGGEVAARAQVTNCGERQDAVRSDLFVLDAHNRQIAQLTHTAVLAPGQTLRIERVLQVPSEAPAAIVCYLLMSQAMNAPIATKLAHPGCIKVIEP